MAIADHYLAKLVPLDEVAPCMVQLGLTCLWIASKLEEHNRIELDCLITYAKTNLRANIMKKDVRDQEHRILSHLAFELRYPSPLLFIERFQRVFDLDRESSDSNAARVGAWSRKFCRFIMLNARFLNYRPS